MTKQECTESLANAHQANQVQQIAKTTTVLNRKRGPDHTIAGTACPQQATPKHPAANWDHKQAFSTQFSVEVCMQSSAQCCGSEAASRIVTAGRTPGRAAAVIACSSSWSGRGPSCRPHTSAPPAASQYPQRLAACHKRTKCHGLDIQTQGCRVSDLPSSSAC
jgi:hypothetical protein